MVTHLFYADALLVFTNGEGRTLKKSLKTLELYGSWFGQAINKAKSSLFISNKISLLRRRGLLRLAGFSKDRFSMTYLRAPIILRRMTCRKLEPLVDKIHNKVASWNGKVLSQGDRLILIRNVLSCMASHTFAKLPIPLMTIQHIHYILATFFWGEQNGRMKRNWGA